MKKESRKRVTIAAVALASVTLFCLIANAQEKSAEAKGKPALVEATGWKRENAASEAGKTQRNLLLRGQTLKVADGLSEEDRKAAMEAAKSFSPTNIGHLFTADDKYYGTAYLKPDGSIEYYERLDGKKFDVDGDPYTAHDVASAAKSSGIDPESRYKWKSKLNVPAWISVQTDATIRGFMKDGRALQELSGTVTSFGQERLLDVPGCRVRIEIDSNQKNTDYCGLIFTTPCALEIAKDDTLLADKESVVAEDAKGGIWRSRKVMLEGKEIVAFFEDKGGQVANETKPDNTGGSKGVVKDSPAITSTTPAPKPATTATGLTLLQTATLDIGKNGEILPHEAGVQAKDRQGNIWKSRKTTLDGKEVFAFFQKEGAQTTTTETKDQPAKAKASLPPYSKTLNGTHEVRVLNPNNFLVNVGVRSGDSGKDFEVRANNGRESIFVPNGRYDIYFIYSDRPDDLYQGDSFTISGNGVQITITKVINGNYGIRKAN